MSDYESIHGTRVKYLTSDPTLDSSYEGQVWYNSTSGTNKALVQIKAWSSGGNMGTARYLIGSCGSQTAALGFGGYSGTYKNNTEEYDGYAWSIGGNLNLARFNPGGAGSQTAALAFGGFIGGPPPSPTNATEEYDGSSWTAQNTMPTAVRNPAGSGTQTAGLSSGGNSGSITGVTQEYDGTNWTTSPGSMNVARENATAFGIQTATIVAGGNEPGVNNAEQYNGSTWTTISDLNSPVYSLASAANGTTSHGITFGGASPAGTGLTQTEEWDGTSWTISSATLAAGKWKLGGAGTASAGLKFAGGPPPSGQTATEHYNSALTTVGAGVWAAGGNLSTARGGTSTSYGTQTASLMTGGERTPGGTIENAVEEYGGTSWTSGTALPTATTKMGGGGTQTAAIMMGGNTPGDVRTAANLDYDGSSWTANPNMPQVSGATRGFGTQTAAICIGGNQNPGNTYHKKTMEWNGSAWSDGGDYPVNNTPNQGVVDLMGFGTQTAALCAGGGHGNGFGSNSRLNTNSYNGSTWSAENDLGSLALFGGAFGTEGGGIISGYAPPPVGLTTTQRWDGNGWTTTTSNTAGSQGKGAGGDLSSGLIIGGIFSPLSPNAPNWGEITTTEEWTGDSVSAITASTLTTS